MSLSILLPSLFMIVPIIPSFWEIFRRKDKGPRKVPEETIYGEERSAKSLLDLERLRAEARIKGQSDVIRIVGDVSIPEGTEINESIVVYGSIKIEKRCRLQGSIKASKEVEVGEETVISGHILAGGKVTIGAKAVVQGIIDSTDDVILNEEATVEAVSTNKSVKVGSGAKIHRETHVAVPVSPPLTQESKPETPIIEGIQRLEKEKETQFLKASSFFEGFFQTREHGGIGTVKSGTEVELTETEAKLLRLLSSGRDVDEIGLLLLLDPTQVQYLINRLVEKKYLPEELRPVRRNPSQEKVEGLQPEAPPKMPPKEKIREEETPVMEIFESLLASKMRDDVRKKIQRRQNPPVEDQNVVLQEKRTESSEEPKDKNANNPEEREHSLAENR